jgi:tetratricopeptide (TPR) repeat protein
LSKILFALVAASLIVACSRQAPEPIQPQQQATFVGSEQCASCHQAEFDQWQGSHHEQAMQVADSDTVLGDFSGRTVSYFDTESYFFERDGEFFVTTQNAHGEDEEFKITHTFGVTPLQQYLVNAPGGRKQALQFAWDSRPESEDGQRWFHLYPDEYIGADDPLHWTGRNFNWNYMCAECHSTNVQLGYDVDTDSFKTTYDEISVGCEACHGPSSRHVEQASESTLDDFQGLLVNLDDRAGAAWVMNLATGIAERSTPNVTKQQAESCGRCHSRRSVIAAQYEYAAPLTDTHMPSLLAENLYHADGRIQEEVYVYGSFVQSKMYAAGVSCSDCHNPHSGRLHAGPDPNDTCAQCHLPSKFATVDHNEVSIGDCVSCHMPATTYMGVDDRRDHSFRIPEAGQSANHYGSAIAAGRTGDANQQLLDSIADPSLPPIARATMLTLLAPVRDKTSAARIHEQLESDDPLLRIAALRALREQPTELRTLSGSHLLRDVVRGVRLEAALTFADYRDLLPVEDARAYAAAADEYREALLQGMSMPESAIQLAEFESRSGNRAEAERFFNHAIRLDREFALAYHAYGLFLVRAGRHDDALAKLSAAAKLAPGDERLVYVYGVALNSLGKIDDAIAVLRTARQNFPSSYDIAWALATVLRDSGDIDEARLLATEMVRQFPEDRNVEALINSFAEYE